MKSRKSQSGFTILELTVAMIAAGFIIVPLTTAFYRTTQQKMVSAAAADMASIGEAAENYMADNGYFPGQPSSGNCATALSVLNTGGYLGSASSQTVYAGNYSFSCPGTGNASVFNISMTTPSSNQAQQLLRQVVRGTLTTSGSPTVYTVATSYVAPGVQPSLAPLLHRYATAGHPEYNQMETPIDMNSNAINNGGEITSTAASTSSANPAFYATAGNFRSDVADTSGPAFYATNSYFQSSQADTTRPAFTADTSYFQSQASGLAFYASNGQFRSDGAANTNVFSATNGNYYAQTGSYNADTTGVAFNATQGSVMWGAAKNTLSTDNGGAIELGANAGGANPTSGATPYIDFHYGNGAAQTYNTRFINSADGQLEIDAGDLFITPGINGGSGNLVVAGSTASGDVVATQKCYNGGTSCGPVGTSGQSYRFESQAIHDAFIVDVADSSGTNIQAPTCSGGETPQIFTAVSQAAQGATAYPMDQIQTWATPAYGNGGGNAPTSWNINMGVLTEQGYSTPSLGYGRVLVLVKCT